MTTLAAVLLVVAANMADWKSFFNLCKSAPKSDIIVLVATFFLTVFFDLVVAIEIGVVLAALLFMKRMAETADIKALARTGRKDDARIALHKLETRLHRDDIKEFDTALTDIRKQYGLENVGAVKKEVETAKKKKSEAEMLLQKGLFAEAKRKFAEEGNSEMAQACSKLIRAKRNIASYVSGIDSVRRSRNMTSKQNAIRELENCSALYRLYNLETAEIEQLIEQYKTI